MANGDNNGITLAQVRNGSKYFQSDATTVNADLKAVQKALYLYGFRPGGEPDGKFGDGTLGAVNGFQNEHGIALNGRIDKATLAKIEAWSGTLYVKWRHGTQLVTKENYTVF
jgi:lysozyme family protein